MGLLPLPDSKGPMRYRHLGTGTATTGATTSRYYLAGSFAPASLTGTAATVAGTSYGYPFYTGDAGVLESVQMRVTTAVTSSTAHVGAYANTSDGVLYPLGRYGSTTDFSTAAAGFTGVTGQAIAVPSDTLIWIVLQASAAVTFTAISGTAQWPILGHSIDTTNYQFPGTCWTGAGTYSTLPATFQTDAAPGLFSNLPAVWLRFSA